MRSCLPYCSPASLSGGKPSFAARATGPRPTTPARLPSVAVVFEFDGWYEATDVLDAGNTLGRF